MPQSQDLSDLPVAMSRTTLDNFPLSMVLADPRLDDCPIVYVNDAFVRTTQYTAEEALGRNCRFMQGPRTHPDDVRTIREALDAEESVTVDILNYRKDGETFLNRLLIAPLRGDDGTTLYFLGVQTEYKPTKNAEERNRELDTRMRELQHRVKNHLSMILAMIRLEAKDKIDAASYADVLGRRVEALSLLYEEFVSEGDGAGRTVDLGAYLSRVASTVHAVSARPSVRLNVATHAMQASLDEAGRVGLVLSEILTNSFRHAFADDASGVVDVDLHAGDADGEVVLIVSDTGKGLAPGAWPQEASLGGQIVLRLVDRIDGEIDVQPGPGGAGTRITLSFKVEPGA